MDNEKLRKNNILLPDLVIDNRVCIPIPSEESTEPKLWHGNQSPTTDEQLGNVLPAYIPENSPNHGSQPMSLPSSLPEPASTEAMQNSSIALVSHTIGTNYKLKRPSQYTGEIGELRSIFEIPPKYRSIFSDYPSFNVIQSKALDILLYTDRPLVISAPTGSGKTVIFELAIINLLVKLNEMNYRGDYKIVYMAPVKALCTERYHDWQEKFSHLGLKCHEVTGDNYDSSIGDLQNYNLVLTTPEKWDSLTRKWRQNKQLVQVVKLFLIDEVHLLSEEKRGPVLEAVVSRMKTIQKTLSYSKHSSAQNCEIQIPIRFIAVSATIPNIEDLADWLGDGFRPAESIKIGEEYRPVKLTKIVLGFPTSLKQNPYMFDMNLSYRLRDLIFKYAEGKPSLIFCSTRKGVTQTAQTLAKEITFHFSDAQRESLILSSNNLVDKKLRDTVLSGVGSHHAGMDPNDRHTTEDLFRRHLLPVLVTTSTLAMGVNLPAHLVIVKSTQQYIGGIYQEYSETQMLQMIGRAGRPQFDKTATAIIMTRYQDKKRYERLVDGKDLIESTLHRHLAEHLNSEVVLETITDVCIAMNWLRSTFLYVRALKNPAHYGFAKGLSETEIIKKLQDLCLYEMNGLASANLVTMVNGLDIRPTDKGRLMASHYLSVETMKIFNKITGTESLNDMILLVASCHEFSDLQLRRVEKRVLNELNKIKDRECIRFPIKGAIKDIPMKVNVLTQATFGCLPINDHSLYQDSLKIMRVGERVTRGLRKYLLNTGHYNSLLNSVLLAKCYSSKLWEDSIYVTKQLSGIGAAYSNLLASAGKTTFQSILIANPRDLERILHKAPPLGNELKKAVIHLPKYNIEINLNTMQNEGNMTLRLENIEDISVFSTAGLNHWLTIIVGDNNNKVIHFERLNDNQLLQMEGEVSWNFSINSNVNEIYGHAISDQWVGIDMNVTIAVKQKGNRPGNILMKKAIDQYVSKMGIPNPMVDKKEPVGRKKLPKLTIVEQIRQKGRQLPELGVKIGNSNVNIPTPMKQSSLDQFLYTPAKKLKLPATYEEFINENASVGKALNKHDFIQNLLPSIYDDKQCQINCPSVEQKLDIQDSRIKECQPPICDDECDREYDSTGEGNQISQDMYVPYTQPHQQEQQGQYSVPISQGCYDTQEEALDDMETTTYNNRTNWGVSIDKNRQPPTHNYLMGDSGIERFRIYDTRSEFTVADSSDNDDEAKWVKTVDIGKRKAPISESWKPRIWGEPDFSCGTEEASSQAFLNLEKMQHTNQRKIWDDWDSNNALGKQFRSCSESDCEITKQPSNSEYLNHKGLPTQNCRQTLHYASCNKESTNAGTASYSESQSEYLQRMKGHFADFKVNTSDEKMLSISKSCLGLFTKDPQSQNCNGEWYGGNDNIEEENQSSQADQAQGPQSFEDEGNRPFLVPCEEDDYNMETNLLDNICNSQRQDQIRLEREKNCLGYERESFNQDPVQEAQLQQETICDVKLKLVNDCCNEPFTNKLKNDVNNSKNGNECFIKQSQEDLRKVRGENVASNMTFTQPIQDSRKHADVHMQEMYRTGEQYTVSDERDITGRLVVLTQNERRHDSDDFDAATDDALSPTQRKGNIFAMKNLQKNDTGEEEVGKNQAGLQPLISIHSCPNTYTLENKKSSNLLHIPPKSEFVRGNEPVKNPLGEDSIVACSHKKQRTEKAFKEKSEPIKECLSLNDSGDTIERGNASETSQGRFDSNNMFQAQFMKRNELSSKTEISDKDQPQKKYNIPKHHFPIFMSYDVNMDENDPHNKQEKLHFKFLENNCSSPEADKNDTTPKIVVDSSTNRLGPRETNTNNVGNLESILNSVSTPKLAFDLEIDSLLDSIDTAGVSSHDSYEKCSQNVKQIPIRNQTIKKNKPDTKKITRQDWDKNDPLMVLFYGPRGRKIEKSHSNDVKASSANLTKTSVQADLISVKSRTTNLQTVDLSSEKKNIERKELVNSNNVSSSKETNVKSAPPETLFPYCKGRAGYHSKVEVKPSSSKVGMQNISKAPEISKKITICQQTKKSEDFSKNDKPIQDRNQNSNIEERLSQGTLDSKNLKDSVQQWKWPQKSNSEMHQQISGHNNKLCNFPQPSILNLNHPQMAQNIISSSNENVKSAATSGCNNEDVIRTQFTGQNTADGHRSEEKILRSVELAKPLPAGGRQQHFQGQQRPVCPAPTDVEVPNGQIQSFLHIQQRENEYSGNKAKNMLPNVPALKKVSTYERVVRIHQANSSWKEGVDLPKYTQHSQQLTGKSFCEAYQTSHISLPEHKEQIYMSNDKTSSTQERSLKLTSIKQAQITSFPRQYTTQSNCNFEEASSGKYPQYFGYQMADTSQQTNKTRQYPSPEQMPDIICSTSSKHSESEGNDYEGYEGTKYKWLASQNTFTQRSEIDEDIFSSNEDETEGDSKLCYDDDAFGNTKSQNSQQYSPRPRNSDSDEYTLKQVDDLEEQDYLSESDIPFVSKKFEYNHTQTPRAINASTSSYGASSLWENLPYDTSGQYSKSKRYEKPGEEKFSSEFCTDKLDEPKYRNVFEQMQNNKFQVSPARKRHDGRYANNLAMPSDFSDIGRDSFSNGSPISCEPRRDFTAVQTERVENQFHELYERDFEPFHKYSRDCMPQRIEFKNVGNYKQESASFSDARSENDVNSVNRLSEQPPLSNLSSETHLESRFSHNPTERFSFQRQNMFQYCQKRAPGIIDSEFNNSKTKHRRHF